MRRAVALSILVLNCIACANASADDFQPGQLIFLRLDARWDSSRGVVDFNRISAPVRIEKIEGEQLTIGPDSVNKGYALHVEEAISYYTNELTKSPANVHAMTCRGAAWLIKGDDERAVEDLSAVIHQVPDCALAHIYRGRAYTLMNDFDAALADFGIALKHAPSQLAAVILGYRSNVWYRKNDMDNAIDDCNAGLLLDLRCAGLYVSRGIVYRKLHRWNEAMADFDQAIKLDPGSSEAYFIRGRLRWMRDEFREAIRDYDDGLRLDPHSMRSEAYFERGVCRTKVGQLTRAIADFDSAIEINSKKLDYFRARAMARYTMGKYDLAIADFGVALDIDPDQLDVLVERSGAHFARGDVEKSTADLDEVVAKSRGHAEWIPTLARALACRGGLVANRGKFAEAMADLQKSIELAPDGIEAHRLLARIMAGCPDPKFRDGAGAVAHAVKLYDLTGGKTWDTLSCLAMAYAENGDFSRAVEYQGKAIDLAPRDQEQSLRSQLENYEKKQPWRPTLKQTGQ